MNRNNKIIAVVVVVILMGASFYGGITYAKHGMSGRGQFGGGGGQFMRTVGQGGMAGMRGGMTGAFVAGEILSKDANGITVSVQGGGSRIVLVASSTQVMKSTTGSQDDLTVGTNVLVTGAQNQDGSVTAQSVQIRPAGAPMMGGR